MKHFAVSDMVRVCNPRLKTYRKVGKVISLHSYYTVEVQIEGFPSLVFKTSNLELVKRYDEIDDTGICKNEKENNDMCVKGNYNVAMVNFVQGVNTTKKYAFALFDETITIDDAVLVDTANGYSVAVVNEIYTKDSYEEIGCSLPTREVICKIDFTAFDERKEKRAKASKLKKEMGAKVKALQEIAVFELLAEKSPELKEMLDEYKNLVD